MQKALRDSGYLQTGLSILTPNKATAVLMVTPALCRSLLQVEWRERSSSKLISQYI